MKNKPGNNRDSCDQGGACDPKAVLEEAYDRCGPDLYRYALMLLVDHDAAQDALQQAFLKMTKMSRRIMEIESLDNYLRTVVRNECYGIIKTRRQSGNVVKELSSEPILEKVTGEIIDEDEEKLIEAALRKLPPDQREVLHLKVYENKTFRQIEELIGIPLNTAASRYRYAIDKLREILLFDDKTKNI